jgi:hypothetical protein
MDDIDRIVDGSRIPILPTRRMCCGIKTLLIPAPIFWSAIHSGVAGVLVGPNEVTTLP